MSPGKWSGKTRKQPARGAGASFVRLAEGLITVLSLATLRPVSSAPIRSTLVDRMQLSKIDFSDSRKGALCPKTQLAISGGGRALNGVRMVAVG